MYRDMNHCISCIVICAESAKYSIAPAMNAMYMYFLCVINMAGTVALWSVDQNFP